MIAAARLHSIKVSQGTADDDPYTELVTAIITRAVSDALGFVSPARHVSPATLQEEAVAWITEGEGIKELLELGGFDAEPVVRAIRRCLEEEGEHDSAITA